MEKTVKWIMLLIFVFMAKSVYAAPGLNFSVGLGPSLPLFWGGQVSDYQSRIIGFSDIIEVGYGFSKAFSINLKYTDVGGYTEDNLFWLFEELGADARFVFNSEKRLNEYVFTGVGVSNISVYDGAASSSDFVPGLGWDFGGGLSYFLTENRHWALRNQINFQFAEYGSEPDHGGIFQWSLLVVYTFGERNTAGKPSTQPQPQPQPPQPTPPPQPQPPPEPQPQPQPQ